MRTLFHVIQKVRLGYITSQLMLWGWLGTSLPWNVTNSWLEIINLGHPWFNLAQTQASWSRQHSNSTISFWCYQSLFVVYEMDHFDLIQNYLLTGFNSDGLAQSPCGKLVWITWTSKTCDLNGRTVSQCYSYTDFVLYNSRRSLFFALS